MITGLVIVIVIVIIIIRPPAGVGEGRQNQ